MFAGPKEQSGVAKTLACSMFASSTNRLRFAEVIAQLQESITTIAFGDNQLDISINIRGSVWSEKGLSPLQ